MIVLAVAAAVTVLNQPPPFKLASGWRMELVAEAPDIRFPTAIVQAADGTIFLGQDPMDMPGPPTDPSDSVVAIKDGRVTVFAEGLWAVMGLEWVDDTLYVVHAPFLSAFRDTDGDGKADRRVDLVTGLGPKVPGFNGINDHVASGIRLGSDGFLYIAVGDKGIPNGVGRDGRTIRLAGGGVIRVRPDGTDLEVVSTGERNPLSVALSATDEVFTYGNDDDSKKWPNSLTHHIVGGHYGYPFEFLSAPDRALPILDGRIGGAGAQGVSYNEDGLAPQFRGNLFFCDWGLQAVARYEVARSGGTFQVKAREYVVRKGTVGDFRPFSIAVGDGGRSLYLVDWAFNGFLADGPKTGRLFRLTYSGPGRAEPSARPAGDGLADRLAALDHPALSVRLAAQHTLAARGPESEGPLVARLSGPGRGVGRLHALWALDSIGTPEARRAIRGALGDADDELKTQAARSAGIRRDREARPALTGMLGASSPVTRREVAIALGRIGDPAGLPALMAVLRDRDPFVAWSIRKAIRALGAPDVGALAEALVDPDRRVDALKLCDEWWSVPVARAMVKALGHPGEPAWRASLVAKLAGLYRRYPEWSGYWFGPNPLAGEFPRKTRDWDSEGMAAVFEGLARSLDDPDPSVRRESILGLIDVGQRALPRLRDGVDREPDTANLILLIRAMGDLRDVEAVPRLARLLADPSRPDEVRGAALEALDAFQVPEALAGRLAMARDAKAPASLVARAIADLGRGGDVPGEELAGFLHHAALPVRVAGLEALAALEAPSHELCRAIIDRLDDPSPEIRLAAIRAVAALKLRETVPRLLELADEEVSRPAAIRALTILPDPRALPAYLKALGDRDPDVRRAGKSALLAVRDSASGELESRARSGQFAGPVALDVERVLARFVPLTDWRVVGPFPRNTPRLPTDPTSIDFDRPCVGAGGRTVAWTPRRGDPSTGRVAIDDLKGGAGDRGGFGYEANGSPDLVAFAYAEVVADRDRAALLLVGSSGTITVTVNGSRAFHSGNDSGRPYSPDADLCRFALKKGVNRIVVRARQGIGAWSFSLQVSDQFSPHFAAPNGPSTPGEMKAYALSHAGDSKRGAALFFDPKGIGCARCHAAGGRGVARIGPDLSGLALKYDKAEIIRSVLEPSERIANGYRPVVLAKVDGTVLAGLLRAEAATHLDLLVGDLESVRVPTSEVEERRVGETSFMPSGLVDPLTPPEFADLIAYLVSLHD